MADSEEVRREEQRLRKSLAKQGSSGIILSEQEKKKKEEEVKAKAKKETANVQPKHESAPTKVKEEKPKEEEKKKHVEGEYIPTAELLDVGKVDHREGVESESGVTIALHTSEMDKLEEQRITNYMGKSHQDGFIDPALEQRRKEKERRDAAAAKTAERLKKNNLHDYSTHFVDFV